MSFYHNVGLGLAVAGLAFSLTTPAANAQTTVFSNLTSGFFQFDPTFRYGYAGPTSTYGYNISGGEGFTVSASGYLSTINIALGNGNPLPPITEYAHLYLADGSGGIPGQILESFALANIPEAGTFYPPYLVPSVSHPFLTEGTQYYLYVLEPSYQVTEWNINSIGETGTHINTNRDNIYHTSIKTQGAFSVQVNEAAVPEASTTVSFSLLLALGMGGVVIAAKRKKQSL